MTSKSIIAYPTIGEKSDVFMTCDTKKIQYHFNEQEILEALTNSFESPIYGNIEQHM